MVFLIFKNHPSRGFAANKRSQQLYMLERVQCQTSIPIHILSMQSQKSKMPRSLDLVHWMDPYNKTRLLSDHLTIFSKKLFELKLNKNVGFCHNLWAMGIDLIFFSNRLVKTLHISDVKNCKWILRDFFTF